MTPTNLKIVAILAAGACALAAAAALGVSPWWGLPLLPAVWLALVSAGRAVHARIMRRALADLRAGRRDSAGAIATDAAIRLRRVAAGEAGFTAESRPVPDLERAVFFPASSGDETQVLYDLAYASRRSRTAIVTGLRVLHEECVAALGRPVHPLYVDAEMLLPLLGIRIPRFLARRRVEHAWARIRDRIDPRRPEECIAERLILAGMPRAALVALGPARRTPLRRTLRRLARLLVVHRLNQSGNIGFPMRSLGVWAPAVVLVMGRRLRELIPGSAFVDAPDRGAAALEAAVRHMPELVKELADLARRSPPLHDTVVALLAAMLERPVADVASDVWRGVLTARPDPALLPHLRGLALLRERRASEAAYEFEVALSRAGDMTVAAYSLAVARRRTGDAKRGAAALREHQILNPSNPDVPILLARFQADSGDRPAARAAYRDGMERFPKALQIRVAYAMQLAAWGDDAAAADQFDHARRAEPGDAQLALLAGKARLHAGRARDAVEPLEQAARHLRGGDRAEAQYLLLSAFRVQGLHDLAKPIADELVEGLGRGQEPLLEEVAEYEEERHDFRRARRAASRARRLRGDRW